MAKCGFRGTFPLVYIERKMGLKFWLNAPTNDESRNGKNVEAFKQSVTMIGMWWRKGRSWVGEAGMDWERSGESGK